MDPIPFDKRSGKIWYNSKLVDWKEANLHILSHGLHYASCVFEGERVYNGEIFKLREHIVSPSKTYRKSIIEPSGTVSR